MAIEISLAAAFLQDPQRRFGRAVPFMSWPVPNRIELAGNSLVADPLCTAGDYRTVSATRSMFDEFLKLDKATPHAILLFASKWGLLGVDENMDLIFKGPEPIAAWRHLAKEASYLLELAVRVGNGRLTAEDRERFPDDPIGDARLFLELRVNRWLAAGTLVMRMRWDEKRRRFGLRVESVPQVGYPLMGALGIQLLMSISNTDRLFQCGGCGQIVEVARHVAAPFRGDRDSYCATCKRQQMPLRKADQRRKFKMMEARRMKREGIGPTQIAADLRVSVESVVKWTERTRVTK